MNNQRFKFFTPPVSFFVLLIVFSNIVFSQTDCTNLNTDNRDILRMVLKECEQSILRSENELKKKKIETNFVERDVLFITTEVKKRELDIRRTDVEIYELNKEINQKRYIIKELDTQLKTSQALLVNLYQKFGELESQGLLSLVLDNENLSNGVFVNGDYQSLKIALVDKINDSFDLVGRYQDGILNINKARTETEQLRVQQKVVVSAKKELQSKHKSILNIQKKIEDAIEQDITQKATLAAQIRNKLFEFAGGGSIPFGRAYEIASFIERTLGVRAAFLLGLIKHESNLGKNVGTAKYFEDMHPTRDVGIFLGIVRILGIAPNEVKVSAAIRNKYGKRFGWGGAMGPAQFIPSTWVCYGGFINKKTGTCYKSTNVIKSTSPLRIGMVGQDVKRLQKFLNENNFIVARSGAGSAGNETTKYGIATSSAVKKFQEHYKTRILEPYNLKRGTGEVGPSTRAAINELEFSKGPWIYKKSADKIRKVTGGDSISNPWNAQDAFIASALYLKALGAANPAKECEAARRYYAGGNWRSTVALHYCRNVLANGRELANDIEALKQ